MFAAQHWTNCEANPTVMFGYIKEVFSNIPQATFNLLSKEPKVKKSKDLILKCNVIKANNLPSKDFCSTSEIYWIATIMNNEFIDSIDGIKESNEKRLIGQTWQSSFKTKTLSPVWNEAFEICIIDPQNQCLVIELWCNSQKEQRLLLGRAVYLLQDIPVSGGEEKMLKLTDESKHSQGTVLVFLKITEKQVDREPEEGYVSHKELLECVINCESKTELGHATYWDCKLSEESDKILIEHASLHRISRLQQVAIQLSVLLNYHKRHRIKVDVFSCILQAIHCHESKIKQHSKDEPWIVQLLNDLKELRNYILNIMNRHLNFFNNFRSIRSISLLTDYVLVLRDLCQIKLLRTQFAPEQMDLRLVLTNAIQTAVPHWMVLLTANMKPDQNTCMTMPVDFQIANLSSENTLLIYKEFCSHCLTLVQRSLIRVHPILMKIGVDYFSPFFTSMDKILYGETSSRLESCSGSSILSFEIYRIIQEIETYSCEVNPAFLREQRRTLLITSFHAWFKNYVFGWVRAAQLRVRERLDRALELDTIVETNDNVPFSSSAVDTHAFFLQAINFWKDLKWPVRGQSLGYFIAILQCICEMAAYYTDKIVARMKRDLSLHNDGDFVVTDKLCVSLNNIHHISEVLKNIPNEINLERYYKWLDEEKRQDGHPLSEKAEITITDVLKSANEDILNKIEHAINVVQAKLLPSVIRFIPKILSAPPNSDLDQIVEPLLEYITLNVGKLGKSLLTPIFHNILHHLWIHIVEALKKSHDKIPHSAESFQHIHLNYVLLHLSYFFEADGKGLHRKFIENELYKTLSDDLFYATQSTEDNIRIFCNDLVKQQASSQNKFGILHVSHIYKPTDKLLSAEIVSGENLQGLEQRRSNAFVQIFLLPTFSEANEKMYKTETKKQTLDPIFNETLKMHISSEQLFKESTILLIAVFGHDTFRSNILIGLCTIPCTSIPIEGTEPKMEHLHLFHYEKTKAYKELELRHADVMAQDFLRRINTCMSENKKGTHFMQAFHKLVHITDKK